MIDNKYYVVLENIELDERIYKINKSIYLVRDPENSKQTILQTDSKNSFESNGPLFFIAMQLALPEANIRVAKCNIGDKMLFDLLKDNNTPLLNYYAAKGDDIDKSDTSTIVTSKEVDNIKNVHQIVIKYNETAKILRESQEWKATRWAYAYNQYLNACHSITLENSILHIITGLEALLVEGEGSLSYKVSLYASLITVDTAEQRKDRYLLLKQLYNLRSKVVHGEIAAVMRILSKSDAYDKYYELKRILSDILIKTFNMREDEVFSRIETMVFKCEPFLPISI